MYGSEGRFAEYHEIVFGLRGWWPEALPVPQARAGVRDSGRAWAVLRDPSPVPQIEVTIAYGSGASQLSWTTGALLVAQQLVPAGEPSVTMGSEGALDHTAFGWIAGVERDDRGYFYVLDPWGDPLTVFDSLGRFARKLGRKGQGPGEFRDPVQLRFDSERRLHVVDPGNVRIETFVRGPEALLSGGQVGLRGSAFDVCVVGERRFVLFEGAEDALIYEADATGDPLNFLGSRIEPTREQARQFAGKRHPLNPGLLACDPDGRRIVYVSRLMGYMKAFDLDGRELWANQLQDFDHVQLTYSRNQKACCIYRPHSETGTTDEVSAVAITPGDQLLVSITGFDQGDNHWFEGRLISLTDGAEVGRGEMSFSVAGYWRGRPYGFRNRPLPQVIAY